MRIHGDIASGNCLKVKYTADHLRLPYEWVAVDVTRGESRTPDFVGRSVMGQVPVVEFDDGRVLAQSNGIIRYLARGSALLPDDAVHAGEGRRMAVLGAERPRVLRRGLPVPDGLPRQVQGRARTLARGPGRGRA